MQKILDDIVLTLVQRPEAIFISFFHINENGQNYSKVQTTATW